jgi:hypothetical protein
MISGPEKREGLGFVRDESWLKLEGLKRRDMVCDGE